MREELKSEINLEDHKIVSNYSDKNENHEIPYKTARIKEEKALVRRIEQNNPINEVASDAINSNSKSVFNEKDSKEIEIEFGQSELKKISTKPNPKTIEKFKDLYCQYHIPQKNHYT